DHGIGIGHLTHGEWELASLRPGNRNQPSRAQGTGIGQGVTRERHWPARAWGTGIGDLILGDQELGSFRPWKSASQLATRDRNQPSQGRGSGMAACDQGTAPASSRPWIGIGQLGLREQDWLARAWRTAL